MTLKHVLKFFSKNSEDLLFPRPLREREELLSEQSELSNSGEGYKELPSPVAFATPSPKCRKTRHFDKMLKQVQHDNFSCAKHTETGLPSNRLNVLTTLKKAAFTLAEVLITLGIIGVVAALTLPTLIQNHQKQTYVTGLKKAYANLQNAFAKMAYDEGVTDWSQTYCHSVGGYDEECFNRFKKQFNAVKSEFFENHDNGASGFGIAAKGYFYTNDGMVYIVNRTEVDRIYVDVNGDKGPNKWGRDRFSFFIVPTKNKIIPAGTAYFYYDSYQTYCTTANVNAGSYEAVSCTAKVLIEGKMDY